jgi:hypothetical protein
LLDQQRTFRTFSAEIAATRGSSPASKSFMSKYLAVGNLSEAHTRDVKIFFPHPEFEFLNVGQARDIYGMQRRPTRTILADANKGKYDLVIAGKMFYPFFNPRKSLVRNLANLIHNISRYPNIAVGRIFPFSKFDGKLAGIDMQDSPVIDNSRFQILKHCVCYFKRELPQNPCNAFLYTTAKTEEGGNVLNLKYFRNLVGKLRPISLGVDASSNLPVLETVKKTDIFFAGGLTNHLNRQRGLKQLESLKAEGYAIDIALERLPRHEFLKRCAEAYLVWSPEGGGWDCYRHYEAALVGSVPLMQSPAIHRYAPLMDDMHACYYCIENNHLAWRIRQALQNRNRLMEMGLAARQHVLKWHTFEALTRYVIQETERTSHEIKT